MPSNLAMGNRAFRSEILRVISRWNIKLEDYDMTSVATNQGSGNERFPRSFAVYGEIPVVGRVVLAVITPKGKTRYADDVIENYLTDVDPKLALELRRDVDVIMSKLSIELCLEIRQDREHLTDNEEAG